MTSEVYNADIELYIVNPTNFSQLLSNSERDHLVGGQKHSQFTDNLL